MKGNEIKTESIGTVELMLKRDEEKNERVRRELEEMKKSLEVKQRELFRVRGGKNEYKVKGL